MMAAFELNGRLYPCCDVHKKRRATHGCKVGIYVLHACGQCRDLGKKHRPHYTWFRLNGTAGPK